MEDPSTSWPGSVGFNPAEDLFLYSVASSYQINVFSHIFVVNFDSGVAPRTMTINLPILENMPTASRIYFFYVEHSAVGDTLTFTVVPGSGDTVNQNPVSTSFALSGNRTLYICTGFNAANWIVFPFAAIGGPSPTAAIPTVNWETNGGAVVQGGNSTPLDTADLYYSFNPSYQDVIPGMEGYMTAVAFIPLQQNGGWLCNQSGVYSFTPTLKGNLTLNTTTTSTGVLYSQVYEYDNTGAFLGAQSQMSCYGGVVAVDLIGVTCTFELNTASQQFYYCTAGNFYAISQTFSLGGTGLPDGVTINQAGGHVVMQFWTPTILPPIPGPELLALSRVPAPAAAALPQIHVAASTPAQKKIVADLQRKVKNLPPPPPPASSSSSSSSGGQNPGFTLKDVEDIVSKALKAQLQSQAASSAPVPAALSPPVASVPGAESATLFKQPPKRKREDEKEKEPASAPPSKK